MKKIFVRLLCLLFSLFPCLTMAYAPEFNEAERKFISEKKIIKYLFDKGWPLEYIKDGHHIGLSREYLNLVEKYSGLIFSMAGENETPDLITNLIPSLMPEDERDKWRYSPRWFTSNTLVVTAFGTNHIRSLEQLEGKRVAIRAGTWHESWLSRHYPHIRLLPLPDARAVFESVWQGRADAGLGSDLVMRPLLFRSYSDKLVIAAQIPEMVAGIHMGMAQDQEILQSIITKSLSVMTATETDKLFRGWVDELRLGYPSVSVILSLYTLELSLFLLLVIVLVWTLRRALLHKRRAIQSEMRKSQFLAMMSHEIRTPMNAMIAALELLRRPCDARQHSEYVTLAWSSSTYLLRLLNDILDHCKLSHQQVQLSNHCFCISVMASRLAAVHQPVAAAKGLTLGLSIENGLRSQWIITDEHRLAQVINNLLSNAIKFTEQGDVRLELSWKSDGLLIDVSDTGIGIPEEAQGTLFHAWTQGDNTFTRRYDGSGLGLYICHEIVKLLNGTLSCSSRPGHGSTFRALIPVTRCEPPSLAAPVNSADLPRFSPENSVLVVEDHPANQKMFSAQLAALGCHCDIAEDGETALNLIKDENYYDVILLDCNLPDIEGYEVARRIRQIEEGNARPAIPIVAISALSGAAHQTQCDESGMDMLLTKPVSLSDLSGVLARWCRTQDSLSDPVRETVLPGETVDMALLEDIDKFADAVSHSDTRLMIYHIHRIKGVAQMYCQVPLAKMADEIETRLRGGHVPLAEEAKQWADALRRKALTSAHP
jgi:two-component system sensor histidine kinase EvgS